MTEVAERMLLPITTAGRGSQRAWIEVDPTASILLGEIGSNRTLVGSGQHGG